MLSHINAGGGFREGKASWLGKAALYYSEG